jgi:hypothetical protein
MACDKYFCGNVIAQYHDNIIIIESTTIKSHEYIVPKSKVDYYDGNDLYLNITRDDMILNFDFWDLHVIVVLIISAKSNGSIWQQLITKIG